jgi:hypothetical protein
MSAFTRPIEVIGFNGKRFKLHVGYSLQGKEPVKIDEEERTTDLNQFARMEQVEVLP